MQKKYYADKKSLNFLRVSLFFIAAAVIAALKLLMIRLENMFPEYFLRAESAAPETAFWIIMAMLATAYVIFILIILPIWYKAACYTLTQDEIIIKTGAISSVYKHMKLSAVQYTTIYAPPFSKRTGLIFLTVNANGGSLILYFLSRKDADEIVSKIQKNIKLLY
jgi:membrane protein YdbS with pleckstrin-like domain